MPQVSIVIATTAVGVALVVLLIAAQVLIHNHFHKQRVFTEEEARENVAPHRPHLEIVPAYYGLPPHNGTVKDPASEEDVAQ